MKGIPLWVMMAGPPSSGKSTFVRAIRQCPRVLDIGMVSGAASFLSGVAQKEREKGATGGMLREVGKRGMFIMEDFTTSVMSRQRDHRQEIIDTLRLVYNGEFSRDVGSGGAKRLVWTGKVGLLAGGTNEIDRQSSEANALGERWIYYRMPESDGRGETRKALRDRTPDETKQALRGLVAEFFDEIGLVWGSKEDGSEDEECRRLNDREEVRISAMSELAARARSSLKRDGRTYEVVDIADNELQTRIAMQLTQMYLGLERIGLPENERWQVVRKIARDSMPRVKSALIWGLIEERDKQVGRGMKVGAGTVKLEKLSSRYMPGCGVGAVKRCVEDMCASGIVQWQKSGRPESGSTDDSPSNGKLPGSVVLDLFSVKLLELGWGVR